MENLKSYIRVDRKKVCEMSKIYNRNYLKMRTIVSHKTLKGNSLFYAKNIVVKKRGKKLFVLWTVDGEKVKNS